MSQKFFEFFLQPMALVGLIGQIMFFSRFLVQWIVSERKGESTIPLAFWFLSIAGGSMLLTYAIWRRDPVIIMGQSVGLLVYLRNLVLIYRKRTASGLPSGASDESEGSDA